MNHTFIQSSIDPDKISLTLRGLFPLIMCLGALKGVTITAGELEGALEVGTAFLLALGIIISAATTLYGAIRRIGIKFQKTNTDEEPHTK